MVENKLNIALIGYGKMGKTIEQVAKQRGHHIGCIIGSSGKKKISEDTLVGIDVGIEFSIPDAAVNNLTALSQAKIPTVCGTTGWLDAFEKMKQLYTEANTSFIYASNFSIGVNVFFELNKYLSSIMRKINGYEVEMTESHHITKLDAPSGTAVTLANQLINNLPSKASWSLKSENKNHKPEAIQIKAIREADVKGMHEINYKSDVDEISIKHEAHSREGFALGAVLAAEYISNKNGIYTMSDVLSI